MALSEQTRGSGKYSLSSYVYKNRSKIAFDCLYSPHSFRRTALVHITYGFHFLCRKMRQTLVLGTIGVIVGEGQAGGGIVLFWPLSWRGPIKNTTQQGFVPRKVYCVSNVTFHAESKYAIKIFPSPTVFVQWHFLLLIFRNFNYFLQWFFFYMNRYFKLFWTQDGHIQFTIIKSLAVWAQKQVVNETNVDSWR
jgi:hypothetical protein